MDYYRIAFIEPLGSFSPPVYSRPFRVSFQISILLFVRAHHDQFEVFINHPVCQKVLICLDFEFMNVNASQIHRSFPHPGLDPLQ
jgi:hypothetical protein